MQFPKKLAVQRVQAAARARIVTEEAQAVAVQVARAVEAHERQELQGASAVLTYRHIPPPHSRTFPHVPHSRTFPHIPAHAPSVLAEISVALPWPRFVVIIEVASWVEDSGCLGPELGTPTKPTSRSCRQGLGLLSEEVRHLICGCFGARRGGGTQVRRYPVIRDQSISAEPE